MSNNVVSQQFQLYEPQMVQMEHVVGMSNSSTVGTSLQFSGHGSHNPVSSVSNENIGPVEHVSNRHGFQSLVVPINQMRPIELKTGSEGFREAGMKTMGISSQSSSVPAKRKAEMEPNANLSRRVAPTGTSPRLPSSQQPSAFNRKPLQMHSKVTSPSPQNFSASNRKLARNDSSSGKSGSHQVQTPKGRTVQMESSKGHTESNDAVRSKMRDNLVAALSLVCQNGGGTANGGPNCVEQASDQQISAAAQDASSDLSGGSAEEKKATGFDNLQMQEAFPEGHSVTNKNLFGEPSTTESTGTPNQSSKELRCSIFPEVDASFGDSFYVKDDLLQGNGLSWAMDLDIGSSEFMGVHDTDKSELVEEGSGVVTVDKKRASPEELASEIEAELFKLFGGVNKKYKEKGRSLLFNLKDRSNPELRERVMSGEIPPDRLCSMTAEELASKELSEWRMAKAEELAQMVVLPDTDFSRRRLVKKTHKGEYQVDFEDDTNVTTDAPARSSVLSQSEPETKDTAVDASPSSKVDNTIGKDTLVRETNKSEKKELSGSLVIPNDGTDLMQGMMVDELKDAEFLPPIISLDEFMDSLDSEPPFEDLQVDPSQSTQEAKENSEAVRKSSPMSDSVAAKKNSPVSDSVEDALASKPNEMVVKHTEDVAPKPSEIPVAQKNPPLEATSPRIEHIWAGTLQLSISSSVTTFGVFKSGEKNSTTEWASSLEIKGRVRLDAFEKFFKELPMSRTRAVMILHLVLKDRSSENERANLAEAVESYISDERLGFAEPASGVELYVCPPHEKMLDLLGNYVAEHRTEFLNSSENGLIGVVVWRKAPISSITSPNSSSHHKHSSKRQHVMSGRSQEKDANVNVKLTPNASAIHNHQPAARILPPPPPPQDDDDSDIPPGFGPSSPREDDDLPEFNFSGNTKPTIGRAFPQTHTGLSAPSRPVDQIRQLIHKYGQNDPNASPNASNNRSVLDNQRSNIGLAMEPWNDDDDDDMPEWQPNMPIPAQPPPHGLVRPLRPVYGSQRFVQTGMQQRMDPRAVLPRSAPAWQHGPGRGQAPGNQMAGVGLASRMTMLQDSQRRDGSISRGF